MTRKDKLKQSRAKHHALVSSKRKFNEPWNFKHSERTGVWDKPKPGDVKSSTNVKQVAEKKPCELSAQEANAIRLELGLPPL